MGGRDMGWKLIDVYRSDLWMVYCLCEGKGDWIGDWKVGLGMGDGWWGDLRLKYKEGGGCIDVVCIMLVVVV